MKWRLLIDRLWFFLLNPFYKLESTRGCHIIMDLNVSRQLPRKRPRSGIIKRTEISIIETKRAGSWLVAGRSSQDTGERGIDPRTADDYQDGSVPHSAVMISFLFINDLNGLESHFLGIAEGIDAMLLARIGHHSG